MRGHMIGVKSMNLIQSTNLSIVCHVVIDQYMTLDVHHFIN